MAWAAEKPDLRYQPRQQRLEDFLSEAVRQELFPDQKMTCSDRSCDLHCQFEVGPRQPRDSVEVVCDREEYDRAVARAKRDDGSGLLLDEGRGTTGFFGRYLDDDTPCVLTVDLGGDRGRARGTALAKRFARLRTPQTPLPVCSQAVVLQDSVTPEPVERELRGWEKKRPVSELMFAFAPGFPKIVKSREVGGSADSVLLVAGYCRDRDPKDEAKYAAMQLQLLYPATKTMFVKGVPPDACPTPLSAFHKPAVASKADLRLASLVVLNLDQKLPTAPYGQWLSTLLDAQGDLLDWKTVQVPREAPNASEDQPYDHESCDSFVERKGSGIRLERSCRVRVRPWSCIERPDEILTATTSISGRSISVSSFRTRVQNPDKCTLIP